MNSHTWNSSTGQSVNGTLPPAKPNGQAALVTAPDQPAARPEIQPMSMYEVFARMAKDPSIEISRLAQLMELQERAEARDAEKQFIMALNRLQPRLPRIGKNGRIAFESQRTGQSQNTAYARFEDIDEKIRPLLIAEGFSISFGTVPVEKGGILITATLSHVAGHSRTESMPLPFDTSGSKNSIQAVGSTFSYGKRYLICAMLNIVTVGEDNDATGINTLTAQQISNIQQMFSRCKMDEVSQSKFLKLMQVEKLADILQTQYPRAISQLNAKLRKVDSSK